MSGPDLEPLRSIAAILLERDLAAFRAAGRARQESLDRLADLERPSAATDLPLAAEAEVALRYGRWADARRSEINMTLARQTATWMEARDAARIALGRTQALDRLSGKG
jgi:hypothetical protein